MICADKLEYRTVTEALQKGNFYASMGPRINALYVEDGQIHIETSPAESIIMHTNCRRSVSVHREKGKRLSRASFPIYEDCSYVRFTVFSKDAKRADTNAYFIEDIVKLK
jgi:hypothetical protein